MTLSVIHAKVSAVADDAAAAAAGEVLPSDWNASHTLTGTASAAQLNSSVVQSVVNDMNVTGSIANQVLTLGWTGRASSSRLPTDTAYIDVAQTWTADQYFKSGKPWFDVRAFGAKGDGATDDTTAFQAAFTAAGSLGSIVFIPPGSYLLSSGISVSQSNVVIMGAGLQSQLLVSSNASVLNISGSFVELKQLQLVGYNNTAVTQSALKWTGGNGVAEDVRIVAGFNGINFQGFDTRFNRVVVVNSYGSAMFYCANCSGTYVSNCQFDQGFPVSSPATSSLSSVAARANTTAYTAGDLRTSQGFLLQCKTSGTSGGSAPTLQVFGVDITDGTVVWRLVSASTFYAMQFDSNQGAAYVNDSDLSGAYTANVALTDTLSLGGPSGINLFHLDILGGFTANILCSAGNNLNVSNCSLSSTYLTTGAGINLQGTWAGRCTVNGNSITTSVNGISANAGTGLIVTGNTITGNTTNGIIVAAGITDFTIVGNNFGSTAGFTANPTAITVSAGASDNYLIQSNNYTGATTSPPVTDGGTGTSKIIQLSNSSLACPTLSGGDAAGSSLTLQSTSNGSPSGDLVAIKAGGAIRATALSNGNLGFGKETSPQFPFVFSSNATTSLNPAGLSGQTVIMLGADSANIVNTVVGYGGFAGFSFQRANNTAASPTTVAAGDRLGQITFSGYNQTGATFNSARAAVRGIALDTYNNTSQGTYLEFDTTPTGSTTLGQAALLKQGFIVGTGTTDPGSGAILYTPVTVASLPSASSSLKGSVASVSDGTAALAWGATVTGGGSTPYLVYCNGAAWTVAGK